MVQSNHDQHKLYKFRETPLFRKEYNENPYNMSNNREIHNHQFPHNRSSAMIGASGRNPQHDDPYYYNNYWNRGFHQPYEEGNMKYYKQNNHCIYPQICGERSHIYDPTISGSQAQLGTYQLGTYQHGTYQPNKMDLSPHFDIHSGAPLMYQAGGSQIDVFH